MLHVFPSYATYMSFSFFYVAKEAANATLQLPPAQIKIMKISKTAREEVMKEYQTQIKEGVKKAVEEVIKQALKDGKKSKTSAAQGI